MREKWRGRRVNVMRGCGREMETWGGGMDGQTRRGGGDD